MNRPRCAYCGGRGYPLVITAPDPLPGETYRSIRVRHDRVACARRARTVHESISTTTTQGA